MFGPVYRTLALCGLLGSVTSAFGQVTDRSQSGQTFVIQSSGISSENRQRVMVARQLIETGNYESAAAMLEIVYEQEPTNQLVTGLLKTCYQQLKQYVKAETLVRRMIAQFPEQFGFRIELAELLADRGAVDSSKKAYRETIAGVPIRDTVRFMLVIRSQINRGFDDDALRLIDSLRRELGDSLAFALDRGSIFEKQKKYSPAVDQYLALLAKDTTSSSMEAERRLMALLGFAESSKAVEARLEREAGTVRNRRVLQLMEDYTLKAGQFDKAFVYAVRRDSVERANGTPLLYYMRRCTERKQFAEVLRMGEYALAHFPNGPVVQLISMSYANALAETGKIREAIAQYDSVRAGTPRAQERGEAIYAQALLYMEKLREYPTALAHLDTVLAQYLFGNLSVYATRDRARCFLRMGSLDSAGFAYVAAAKQANTIEIREEAAYYGGLLHLFRNQYDSCRSALRKLMVDYPAGFYINDALQQLMALEEAKDSPEILAMYANAALFSERLEWDSARLWLDRLTLADNRALADDALHRMTQISMIVADTTTTLESIERLASGFPESYFAPYGMKLKADILLAGRGTPQQAREIYRLLLEQFPNYPFATEVRKRLRQLDSENKVG